MSCDLKFSSVRWLDAANAAVSKLGGDLLLIEFGRGRKTVTPSSVMLQADAISGNPSSIEYVQDHRFIDGAPRMLRLTKTLAHSKGFVA